MFSALFVVESFDLRVRRALTERGEEIAPRVQAETPVPPASQKEALERKRCREFLSPAFFFSRDNSRFLDSVRPIRKRIVELRSE